MKLTRDIEDFDEGRDGVSQVIEALQSLAPPTEIDDATAADRDVLTDLLLDRMDEIEEMNFLYLLTCIQVQRLDELAREVCAQEYWLLDPHGVAEEAVVSVFTRLLLGERVRPFVRWARVVVRRTAEVALVDSDAKDVLRVQCESVEERDVIHEMMRVANGLPRESRRIAWLAWVCDESLPKIALQTGRTVAEVEELLARVVQDACVALERSKQPKRPPRRRGGRRQDAEGGNDVAS